jgi:hypothetical protein
MKRKTRHDVFDIVEYLHEIGGMSYQDILYDIVRASEIREIIANVEHVLVMNDIQDPLIPDEDDDSTSDSTEYDDTTDTYDPSDDWDDPLAKGEG